MSAFTSDLPVRIKAVLSGITWPPSQQHPVQSGLRLIALGIACSAAYGAVMGLYDGRPLQVLYSAMKVPILLGVTAGLGLPSFFVINSLMGLRDDFAKAVGSLLHAQAALALVLASLTPFTALWYSSTHNYNGSILFNAAIFAVASYSSQVPLRRMYRPLIARNTRHQIVLRIWLGIYAFVGIQMGWVLRPFIGNPASPVQFFRDGAWGNAYVYVAELIRSAL